MFEIADRAVFQLDELQDAAAQRKIARRSGERKRLEPVGKRILIAPEIGARRAAIVVELREFEPA